MPCSSTAYHEEIVDDEERRVLSLPPAVAPIQVAVFPLMNRDGLPEIAGEITDALRCRGVLAEYDDSGAIGRRYRRQDEVGTPFAITVDYDTKEDRTVTLRDRDSMRQVRIGIEGIPDLIRSLIDGTARFCRGSNAMKWITHPFIRPGTLESRTYQLSIAMRALDGNTMVVLPTGLGKTAIALIVAASRLYNEKGKVLMLAPTKPLVEQHYRFFRRYLLIDGKEPECALFTGESPPDERREAYSQAALIFATPQVIKNDLLSGAYTLADVTLLIVDECHRAVGNYAYVFIASVYRESARSPLLLAMTASPGGQEVKVEEVCHNLGIAIVETRTEQDTDVAPYVHERAIQVIEVDLPLPLKSAVEDLNELLEGRISVLKELGFDVPKRQQLSMKSLNALNALIQERIQERDAAGYTAASLYAELMKLRHAVSLAESQGSRVLALYVHRLFAEGSSGGGSKAAARLAKDPVFIRLLERCMSWDQELHPKMEILAAVTAEQLGQYPESRIIIFATFRDMVQQIVEYLAKRGIHAERFVGQATKDTERGLSQKQQIDSAQKVPGG